MDQNIAGRESEIIVRFGARGVTLSPDSDMPDRRRFEDIDLMRRADGGH